MNHHDRQLDPPEEEMESKPCLEKSLHKTGMEDGQTDNRLQKSGIVFWKFIKTSPKPESRPLTRLFFSPTFPLTFYSILETSLRLNDFHSQSCSTPHLTAFLIALSFAISAAFSSCAFSLIDGT